MKRLFFAAFILEFLLPLSVHAQCAGGGTCTLPNCNESTVNSALNSINTDGTVVVLPTCNVQWTGSTNVITYNQTNSYTLEGQTTVNCTGTPGTSTYSCTATDNTIIVDDKTADVPLLALGQASGKTVRLTGITFKQASGAALTYNGILNFSPSSFPQTAGTRVDHCDIYEINRYPISFYGDPLGVMDHNVMVGYDGSVWRTFGGTTWQSVSGSFGDAEWASPTALGSNEFMFFENNYIVNGSNDCTQGGRFVIRYNTYVANADQTNQVTVHPTGGGGRDRGCRAWEVYKNYFSNTTGTVLYNVYWLNSGTGVIWGNSATTNFQYFVTLWSLRRDSSTYPEEATPSGWGYCGTSFTGTGSRWDQNSNTSTGYRCLDQPGQGQGQLLANDFPSAVNTATGTIAWPHEALEPIYEWLDAWGSPGYGSFASDSNPDALFANSDYYISSDPGSGSDCSGFTGATGVGCGTLASRPSTCTIGVGYWATDQGSWNQSGSGGQGELSTCTATNTWSASPTYTPYAYPHPLDSTTQTSGAPVAPTGLQAALN